jgi:7,8-dihydropterin-6-yl-methyl-4-(beta-D-ribofuranosyl)aminobenzene 5'-phosphate synthase
MKRLHPTCFAPFSVFLILIAAGTVADQPVALHPDAYLPRYLRLASGQVAPYYNADLTPGSLSEAGGRPVEHTTPLEVGPGLIATGAIPREVDFERPPSDITAPDALIQICGHETCPDVVPDDQALVIEVGRDGIVVLSGCAHAGIINTLQ